jgi:MFS family permease
MKDERSFTVSEPVQMESPPPKSFYGWINVLLLTFIYMATTGLVFYAFSVIFPEMLKAMGWSRGDASIAISVNMLAGGFLIPLAAKFINKYGSRRVIIVGLAILFINMMIMATAISKLWHWTAIWGILIPMGRVLCGLIPSQLNIMFWFNRKRAIAIGILMTGAPIGGFLAPPVYTWVMANMGGWKTGWVLSAGVLLIALVASFWVKSKPSDVGQYPDGVLPGEAQPRAQNATANGQANAPKTYRTKTPWTLKEVLKNRIIWLITVVNITQGMGLGLVVYHGVLHFRDLQYDPMKAAFILSMIIVSSGIVRIPIGWLGDRVEPRWILSSCLALMVVGFIGIWKAPSFALLMVLGPVYGISFGGILTIMPTLTGNYYGPEVFANINGFFGPFVTVIGAAVPTIAGYAVERLGSYNEVFLVLTALIVLGLICSFFLAPPQKKEG